MDAKLVIAFLFAAFIAVSCKPTGDAKDVAKKVQDDGSVLLSDEEYYKMLKRSMDDLNVQVSKFRDAIKKKREADAAKKDVKDDMNSLEESLKQAVAEDKERSNDESSDERSPPAVKDTKSTSNSFYHDDADFMDYDFDEYDANMEKAQKEVMKKDAAKAVETPAKDTKAVAGPHLDRPSDVQIIKPQIMDPNDGIPNNDVQKKQKKDAKEMADVVKGIKDDILGITTDFKEMKDQYQVVYKEATLDEDTKKKFVSLRADITNVMGEFKSIKDEFSAKKDAMEDELPAPEKTSALKDMLNDMKAQLMDVAINIKDLKEAADEKRDQMQDEKPTEENMDNTADATREEKELADAKKSDIELEDEKSHMQALKDELKGVLADMKTVKDDLLKAKDNPTQKKEIVANSDARLQDLKAELDLIRDEVQDIKGKSSAIAA